MDWITSTRLLEALHAGDDGNAWDEFVGRFRPPIVSFARGMGLRPPEAEDVAQEVFLTFAKHYRDGRYDRSKGRLSKWLFGIARNHTLSALRNVNRGELNLAPGQRTAFWSALPDSATTSALWDTQWQQAILRHCLAQVSREVDATTFAAFEMVAYGQRPPAETAASLGITVKAVYNAKHRILKRIRALRADCDDRPVEELDCGLL